LNDEVEGRRLSNKSMRLFLTTIAVAGASFTAAATLLA
jgi:hypothetical protein